MKSKLSAFLLAVVLVVTINTIMGCAIIETPIQNAVLRRKSTPELKLRHNQLAQRLGDNRLEVSVGPFGGGTKGHEDEWNEKERIERELLKRYQAGDKEAFLPIFKSVTEK
jgi:hypothetical protein